MENNNPNDSSRPNRKLVERNRRTQMKALFSKLNSLLPHNNSRPPTSLSDQLHESAKYIKKLQMDLERVKEKKDMLMRIARWNNTRSRNNEPKSPEIQIHDLGSSLVIGLTTCTTSSRFIFNQTIRILQEEGTEIANASFSVVDDTVFHTIHLTVGHDSAPDDWAAAKISERLDKFVNDADA